MTSTAVLQQLRARENGLTRLDVALAELDTPVTPERLTVIPSWVKQQVSDVVNLLQDRPERPVPCPVPRVESSHDQVV
jgi:hypothetical protein